MARNQRVYASLLAASSADFQVWLTGQRRLIDGHKLIAAGRTRKKYAFSIGATKIAPHLAVSVDVLLNVLQLDFSHQRHSIR